MRPRMEPTELQPIIESRLLKNANEEVRRGFVLKVYGLLSAQLLVSVGLAAPFQYMTSQWLIANVWLLFLSSALTLSSVCIMACCKEAQVFPLNYILLSIFTLSEGLFVGMFSANFTWQSVLGAAVITTAVVVLLTMYAATTTTDFTGVTPYVFAAVCVLLLFSFISMIFALCGIYCPALVMVYDLIGVLVFVMYLVLDTQRILGDLGGHEHQFTIDEYVFATMTLYLDIVNLFVHILRVLGDRK